MRVAATPIIRAGLVAGLVLFLNAWLPNSHAWPLLWPFLGAATAVLWTARHGARRLTVRRTLGLGVGVGALAAAVALVIQVPTYGFLTTRTGLHSRAHSAPPARCQPRGSRWAS